LQRSSAGLRNFPRRFAKLSCASAAPHVLIKATG
jgi:hypothetical protein